MSNQEFPIQYYVIQTGNEPDFPRYKSSLDSKLANHHDYRINKISDEQYLIHHMRELDMDILPKKGSKENTDVNDMRPLDIEDDESLFKDVYILLSLEKRGIFENGLGIISVLKTGKESTLFLQKLFSEIFGIGNEIMTVLPIPYRNADEYIKSACKITQFSFRVPGISTQYHLTNPEDSDDIGQLLTLRDRFRGKDIQFTVSGSEGLDKNAVIRFYKTYKHISGVAPSISLVDDIGEKVQQQIDKIRFKGSIILNIEESTFDENEVLPAMIQDYDVTIERIEKDISENSSSVG